MQARHLVINNSLVLVLVLSNYTYMIISLNKCIYVCILDITIIIFDMSRLMFKYFIRYIFVYIIIPDLSRNTDLDITITNNIVMRIKNVPTPAVLDSNLLNKPF